MSAGRGSRARRRRGPRPERGAVTAELALGLPVLVALTIGLVWMLSLGAAQVRAVDAARETARAVARGDATGEAVALGRRVAPAGADVTVGRDGDLVHATVEARLAGPGGLFAHLPAARVRAEAYAVAEETGADPGMTAPLPDPHGHP